MKFIKNPPDGHVSWERFKEKNNESKQIMWGYHIKDQVNILTKDNGMVTLFPDGTWGYDCAPFWDGSS